MSLKHGPIDSPRNYDLPVRQGTQSEGRRVKLNLRVGMRKSLIRDLHTYICLKVVREGFRICNSSRSGFPQTFDI